MYSDLALSVIVAEPVALEVAHDAFLQAQAAGYQLDLAAIGETLNEIFLYHAPLEHGSEVAWSLYILRELGLKVSSDAAARVVRMRDNCSLLLLMEATTSGMIDGTPPPLTGVIAKAEDPNAPVSEDWLLAYEAGRLGWANDGAFQALAHWAELRKLGVRFFLTKAAVKSAAATTTTTKPLSPTTAVPAPATTPAQTPAPPPLPKPAPVPAPPPIALVTGLGAGGTSDADDDDENEDDEYF